MKEMLTKWLTSIAGVFKKGKTLQQENKELAILVRVLLSALEDGKLTSEEKLSIKKAAYEVVIKYNL